VALHKDPGWGRVMAGGNKAAKSTWGAVEMLLWLMGSHPYRETPPVPCYGRVLCQELPITMDKPHVQRDLVREWCPQHWLRGGAWDSAWSNTGHTLRFGNGSLLEFYSFEQPVVAGAGARQRAALWIDEECVDAQTEILSEQGWITHEQVVPGMLVYTYNVATRLMEWKPVQFVHRHEHEGSLIRMGTDRGGVDALVTEGHRWPVYEPRVDRISILKTTDIKAQHFLIRMGAPGWDVEETETDQLVELLGWVLTEGHVRGEGETWRIGITQANEPQRTRLRALIVTGGLGTEKTVDFGGSRKPQSRFRLYASVAHEVAAIIGEEKRLPMEFVRALSRRQLRMLYETLLSGDGHVDENTVRFSQKTRPHIADLFQVVATLLGHATRASGRAKSGEKIIYVQVSRRNRPIVWFRNVRRERVEYRGTVWCPNTDNGTFVARRNGRVYITGNCPREQFMEHRLRLDRRGAGWWLTFAPIGAEPWIEEELWRPAVEGRLPGVKAVRVSMRDNAHNLPEGFVEAATAGMSDADRKIRIEGEYARREGAVFDFRRDPSDFDPDRDWLAALPPEWSAAEALEQEGA